MALTLAEAKETMVDPIDQTVIDEFRRSSLLLDSLTFDDAAEKFLRRSRKKGKSSLGASTILPARSFHGMRRSRNAVLSAAKRC